MAVLMRGKVKLRIPAVELVSPLPSMRNVPRLTECVVDANNPGHSLLTLNGRKNFGRILECDRAFTQGVADSE